MGRLAPGYTLLVLLLFPHHAAAADVADVLARMRRAVEPGGDMRAGVELIMTNAHGERVRWQGEFYRIDGANPRKRLVLESPEDLRGVSVTVQRVDTGADRYRIYLPFVRRVREIEADERGEPFLGTDFNYEGTRAGGTRVRATLPTRREPGRRTAMLPCGVDPGA